MWPALMMFWGVAKIVHHGSSCCRGLDQYYCLPPRIYEQETAENPYINPSSRFWELELFEKHHQNQRRRGLLSQVGPFSVEDNSVESMGSAHLSRAEEDTVARVDHYTQVVPETLINTDDEITYLSGTEDAREDVIVGPWVDMNDVREVFPKYL